MTYELLYNLKMSGCNTLLYGVESFSNNVLKRMKKIFTKEIVERVLEDTYKVGIEVIVNIIVGFPGETDKDFQETVDAIKRNCKYITSLGAISICLVNNDCDLEYNPQRYEIVLSSDPKVRPTHWTDLEGKNTYEIRKRKAEEILGLINQLGLSYETKNI